MNTASIHRDPGATLPEELAPSEASRRRWAAVRDFWMPETIVIRDADGTSTGAALTMARPGTAYRKIVDVLCRDVESFTALLGAACDSPGTKVVHVEQHEDFPPTLERALRDAGFARQTQAMPSVASTLLDTPQGVRVWSRWTDAAPTRTIPYYGQTTEVTCGAVTGLGAIHAAGHGSFTDDYLDNHALELRFWRQATNLPAIDPVALAVATREELGRAIDAPRVIISTDGPVLLEEYHDKPGEIALRRDLQGEAYRQAALLGVPIEHRWIGVDEIHRMVAAGTPVGILIDLTPLINDTSPHWVLAYDTVGEDLIVSDPWVDADNAESWADTFALPLPPATVDLVARWGDPSYRAVVVFPAFGPHGQ